MTDYTDNRSEQELADRLVKKIVFKLRSPVKLVQSTFDVTVMNEDYVVTVEPKHKE